MIYRAGSYERLNGLRRGRILSPLIDLAANDNVSIMFYNVKFLRYASSGSVLLARDGKGAKNEEDMK